MTPEQEEQVRRALEGLRQDGPAAMPPEVVARLDRVLGELVGPNAATRGTDSPAGSGTPSGTASGTDELAARRRRRWPNVLVAAAATAVIAFAGAAVATRGFGGSGASTTSAEAGHSPQAAARGTAKDGLAPPGNSALAAGPSPSTPAQVRSLATDAPGAPRLHTATLAEDVQRVADAATADAAGQRQKGADGTSATRPGAAPPAASCAQPVIRPGDERLVVRLDGKPATLVLCVTCIKAITFKNMSIDSRILRH